MNLAPALKNAIIFISLAGFLSLTENSWGLSIRQETIQKNGILVSRPNTEDISIFQKLIQSYQIHSINDYASWLQTNIFYESDKSKDTWEKPEATLNKKRGDCEDYAFLSAAVMRMLGYYAEVLAVTRPRENSHAICIFKENNYYHWFDNAHLQRTTARSIPELLQHIQAIYPSAAFFKLDYPTRTGIALR